MTCHALTVTSISYTHVRRMIAVLLLILHLKLFSVPDRYTSIISDSTNLSVCRCHDIKEVDFINFGIILFFIPVTLERFGLNEIIPYSYRQFLFVIDRIIFLKKKIEKKIWTVQRGSRERLVPLVC